ncbi:MAG: hypothetical protein R3256_13000, partial [Thalassovita sp.]|nr:hypothetical protein [Thalassovita sp.]
QLGGPDRSHISTGTCPDHDDVKCFGQDEPSDSKISLILNYYEISINDDRTAQPCFRRRGG